MARRAVQAENLVALDNRAIRAVEELGIAPQFLGTLLWFTISECRATKEELTQLFLQAGLDEKFLPNDICPRDAFRKATRVAELKKHDLGEGKYLNLLVREVKMDSRQIIRHIVREVVDGQNTRLEYTPVIALILEGEGYWIRTEELTDQIAALEKRAATEVVDAYNFVERQKYDGRIIRDIVIKVLRTCDPVNVRPSGGVYFVPKEHDEKIRALQKFVCGLSDFSVADGNKSRLWMVPVIDTAEQRAMIQESLEDQVKNEARALIEEMTKIIRDGERRVTQKLAEQYIERVKNLNKLVKNYEEMLETEIIAAKSNLELAQMEAMKLLENIEV